jgi:hypothetical protein
MHPNLAAAQAEAEVEFTGTPRVINGPNPVEGKDYTRTEVVLADGTQLVTFSKDCAEALKPKLDAEVSFVAQKARQDGWAHKIVRIPGVWEPKPRGQFGGKDGKQWTDTSPSQEAAQSIRSAQTLAGILLEKDALKAGDVVDWVIRSADQFYGAIQDMKGQAKPAAPAAGSDAPLTPAEVASSFNGSIEGSDDSELSGLWAQAVEAHGGQPAAVLLKLAEKYQRGFTRQEVEAGHLKELLGVSS